MNMSEDYRVVSDAEHLDDKDRPLPKFMSDREIAEETLLWLRSLGDIVEGVASNPTIKAMTGL